MTPDEKKRPRRQTFNRIFCDYEVFVLVDGEWIEDWEAEFRDKDTPIDDVYYAPDRRNFMKKYMPLQYAELLKDGTLDDYLRDFVIRACKMHKAFFIANMKSFGADIKMRDRDQTGFTNCAFTAETDARSRTAMEFVHSKDVM